MTRTIIFARYDLVVQQDEFVSEGENPVTKLSLARHILHDQLDTFNETTQAHRGCDHFGEYFEVYTGLHICR